jgi:hypothetical protein
MRRQRQFPGPLVRDRPANRELVRLLAQLDGLLGGLDAAESVWREWLANVAPGYQSSARNIYCAGRSPGQRRESRSTYSGGSSEPFLAV